MKFIIYLSIYLLSLPVLWAQENNEDQYMNAYIVVSDTSQYYYKLRNKMLVLSTDLNMKIDTMRRTFNSSKQLICLAEDDFDEIYAGDYVPRRYPSTNLSLEYLSMYTNKSQKSRTIALVTCITDDREKAEKALKTLKKYSAEAFIVNTDLYMGCLH